jgi:polyisoprenoid-binding protein YceI
MRIITKLLLSILFILQAIVLPAQKSYTLTANITAEGTSNTHDWTVKSENVQGSFILNTNKEIESLNVKISVESLKSILDSKFERKQMENLVLKAFNSDKNPMITFQLSDISVPAVTSVSASVTLNGSLTMAGVTKKVSFKAEGRPYGSGGYRFSANIPLKFTDYGMKPPVALLIMKVKDPLTVKLDVIVPNVN